MKVVRKCKNHPSEPALAACNACGAPICKACRQEFGYFCGAECKGQARKKAPVEAVNPEEEARFEHIRETVERGRRIVLRWVLPVVVLLVVGLIVAAITSKAGKTVWTFKPKEDKALSPPVAAETAILVACDDGNLYALGKQDGQVKWQVPCGEGVSQSKPVLVSPRLCVVSDAKNLYGVDMEKGSPAWKRPLEGIPHERIAAAEGIVYYMVHIHRELTAEERTKIGNDLDRYKRADDLGMGFLDPTGTKVFVRSSLYALNAESGKEAWSRNFERGKAPEFFSCKEGSFYYSASDFAGNKAKHVVTVLDAKSGKGKWRAEIGGGYLSMVHPAKDGTLLVSQERLYFLSPEGKEVWRGKRGRSTMWEPLVTEDKIYCRESSEEEEEKDRLVCLDLRTGRKLWSIETASLVAEPVVGQGAVYLTDFVERERTPGDAPKLKLPEPQTPGLDQSELLKPLADQGKSTTRRVPVLLALDSETGKVKWSLEEVGGSVMYAEGCLFVVGSGRMLPMNISSKESTAIVAIKAGNGKQLWRSTLEVAANHFERSGNRLYLTSHLEMVCHGSRYSHDAKWLPAGNSVIAISIGR